MIHTCAIICLLVIGCTGRASAERTGCSGQQDLVYINPGDPEKRGSGFNICVGCLTLAAEVGAAWGFTGRTHRRRKRAVRRLAAERRRAQ